ncbi:MAG TPA: hypothetical protein VFB99_16885 [Vicinamibacterales bacterium]|nr:hypothetical protein [Vicinamibacterales bacterium]
MPSDHYQIPIGTVAGPSVRAYRAAALSTGNAGTLATLAWDQVTSNGVAHAAGIFTIPQTGIYEWEGGVTIGTSAASEFRVVVEVDDGGGYDEIERASVPGGTVTLGLLTVGPGTARLGRRVELVAGDLVRVRFGSFTAGSEALVVGQSSCWFAMRMI